MSNLSGLLFALLMALPGAALSQVPLDAATLRVPDPAACTALANQLDGRASGGQWIVGSSVPVFGLPNSLTPIQTLTDSFTRVSCFSEAGVAGAPRVFVSAIDGGMCGWVARADLLDENRQSVAKNVSQRAKTAVCDVPRAMSFDTFCQRVQELSDSGLEVCEGVPPGLRAKGVLIGSTDEAEAARFPFMSAPRGGQQRAARSFFSVLEIHDVSAGQPGQIMVLVGDGEGELFGWIDLDSLELWPTRLGLFYDAAGLGQMFQRKRDLLSNWRSGAPQADITSGLGSDALRSYVHGALQLLSYPIIRTVDPKTDLKADPNDTPYHEVIFLGQTGEGSASQLISGTEFANRVEALQRINVMLVIDTTESMRTYLPLVQQGITRFIGDYGSRSLDGANRLPELRIAVYAYSDFMTAAATGLKDPIRTAELMAPSNIGLGFDVTSSLARISAHKGLDDAVGERSEAGLEAVAQLSSGFADKKGWFVDGPRIIIHIADHGSRLRVKVAEIEALLKKNKTFYFPLAVVTADENAASVAARQAFTGQATELLRSRVADAAAADVAKIDLLNYRETTPEAVRGQLDIVMSEVVRAVNKERANITNDTELADSLRVQDLAASRIRLAEALLDTIDRSQAQAQMVVKASTAFAPFSTVSQGVQTPIDWTYTVALEPDQARFLRLNFEAMCKAIGSPEQGEAFRTLIVKVAEAFSGDVLNQEAQIRAILSDMRNLPGADKSFLSQTPDILVQRADSTDRTVVEDLRRDVCWISYHLNNMETNVYAKPNQLQWTGSEFQLKPGEQVIGRQYRYKPVIGAETVYVPSFFFVLPSVVIAQEAEEGVCKFFCN